MIRSTAKWVKRRARAPRSWIRSAAKLWAWLTWSRACARVSKKCETGEAIALIRFLDEGRFSMTNNVAERQLHAIEIGRKTWILADSMSAHCEPAQSSET
jgi:Transposase IS66 family